MLLYHVLVIEVSLWQATQSGGRLLIPRSRNGKIERHIGIRCVAVLSQDEATCNVTSADSLRG